MSLPAAWVDRIFAKLTVTYGREFLDRWEGIDPADVKTDWGHELAAFNRWPEAIAHALESLPAGRPPTVADFKAAAYKAPAPDRPGLPQPRADPERVAAELARLQPIRKAAAKTSFDHKAWARRILACHDVGERVQPISLRFARKALGLAEPAKATGA
jgi:hypothetical protein